MATLMQALKEPWVPARHGKAPYLWICSLCFMLWKYAYVTPGILEVAALVLLVAAAISFSIRFSPYSFLIPALTMGLSVGVATVMDASLRRSREQLLRKQEEVEHLATIAERERISRDLHDLLGHTLSLITLKAELAGKLLERDAAACGREIADIEQSARNALAEVRSAVSGYRQAGLAHELANARVALASAGVTLDSALEPIALGAAAENVLALVLREAVTNILRHAGARRCDFIFATQFQATLLQICRAMNAHQF